MNYGSLLFELVAGAYVTGGICKIAYGFQERDTDAFISGCDNLISGLATLAVVIPLQNEIKLGLEKKLQTHQ